MDAAMPPMRPSMRCGIPLAPRQAVISFLGRRERVRCRSLRPENHVIPLDLGRLRYASATRVTPARYSRLTRGLGLGLELGLGLGLTRPSEQQQFTFMRSNN